MKRSTLRITRAEYDLLPVWEETDRPRVGQMYRSVVYLRLLYVYHGDRYWTRHTAHIED